MQFSHIHLENWRNFAQVDVRLQNRAFLVGANASGKSNFLDVFRFLRDIVSTGGGFQEAVRRRGGVSKIRNLAARANPNVTVDVTLPDTDETTWRYRLVFAQDNISRPVLKEEHVWQNEQSLLSRPDADDNSDKARLYQTLLEQTFANQPFRAIADTFRQVQYLHIVPQLVREPERSVGKQDDPYGGDFLEQIGNVPDKTRAKRLERIQQALSIAVPQLVELEWKRNEQGIAHLVARYANWRARGVFQNETELSDGTLRLIGLLWAVQTGEGLLLLEEPELSLHQAVVRYLPQMLRNVQRQRKRAQRQIFISSHSSDLLRDEGIAADETLLFVATHEGTMIRVGADIPAIRQELQSGFTLAEAVIPRTEPENVRQLARWGE